MARHTWYFVYLLIISVVVYIPGTCTEISDEEPADYALGGLKEKSLSDGLFDKAILPPETCNDTHRCQNAGTCSEGACKCPEDYTGTWCETPAWCTVGRCGYGSDVECVWHRLLRKGECRCKDDHYYYNPKDRKCYECDCKDHGECLWVDDMMVRKCDDNYALKSLKCERCDCGPWSEKCSFNSGGTKVCQCQKGHAPKTVKWSLKGTWCETCDCGDHGRCRWDDNEKICDCETGYKVFGGKCKECSCGSDGTCKFDQYGEKVCTCDSGSADDDGTCLSCECNLFSKRYAGVNCTFHNGFKHCICPPGFKALPDYCKDIDECYTDNPCPDSTLCINKPGTFECRCRKGFKPIDPSLDPRESGCIDIDECLEFPCESWATRCVNSPGSYDCVCKDGYYSTAANYGGSYMPSHNACYEIETQWREATIALGLIFSVAIIGIIFYIKKHRSSS